MLKLKVKLLGNGRVRCGQAFDNFISTENADATVVLDRGLNECFVT